MRLTIRKGLFVLLGLLLISSLQANNPGEVKSMFNLMHYQEVLELTLETDITLLKGNRAQAEALPATIKFTDAEGKEQLWKMKVEQRGRFRRLNCSEIPPLKLKFKKSKLEEVGLARFNDMKLVTQCVENRFEAQELLKKEYMAYKLYNEVSAYSFRVQLLRITYKDINTGKKKKQWAFLIEDTAELRARIGADKCKSCYNLQPEQFETTSLKEMSLFQYMIGNADWSLVHLRNVKLLRKDGKVIPVPYDFDFSGLVNASYAIPNPDYSLQSVKERVYLGFVSEEQELQATINMLCSKKEQFLSLIKQQKLLSGANRREMKAYLNEFLEQPTLIWPKEKTTLPKTVTTSTDE